MRRDLTGETFGRLTVLGFIGQNGKATMWKCLCTCGEIRIVSNRGLLYKGIASCGCEKEKYRRHGMTHTPTWQAWASMIARCTSKTHECYPRYGGRGISVCARWHSFANFLADMGLRPGKGYSLDRVDNDGNYEVGNCRWATYREQNRNRGAYNRFLTVDGQTQTMSEWARQCGLSVPGLQHRLAVGWTPEQAIGLVPKPAGKLSWATK